VVARQLICLKEKRALFAAPAKRVYVRDRRDAAQVSMQHARKSAAALKMSDEAGAG